MFASVEPYTADTLEFYFKSEDMVHTVVLDNEDAIYLAIDILQQAGMFTDDTSGDWLCADSPKALAAGLGINPDKLMVDGEWSDKDDVDMMPYV